METFLNTLKDIYEREKDISSKFKSDFPVNTCQNCFKCCANPVRLRVSSLELEYIKLHLSEIDKDTFLKFISFINALKDEEGNPLVDPCPFYNNETKSCLIYDFRPFCCRYFGSFGGINLPDNCFYKNISINLKEEGQDLSVRLLELRQGFYRTLGPDYSPVTDLDKMFIAMVLYERGEIRGQIFLSEKFGVKSFILTFLIKKMSI